MELLRCASKHVINTRHNPFWRVAGWFVRILWRWCFSVSFGIFWGVCWVFFGHKLLLKAHFWCFFRRGGGLEGPDYYFPGDSGWLTFFPTPPPLYKKHLRVTVPSHPRGNVPQVTVPSPPPPPPGLLQGTRDTKQDRQITGHVNH